MSSDRLRRESEALRVNYGIEDCTGDVTPELWELIKGDIVNIIYLCPGHALPAVLFALERSIRGQFVPEGVALRWFGDVPSAVFDLIDRVQVTIANAG